MTPRWIERLLTLVVHPDERDEWIGDLHELHGRRVDRWGRLGGAALTIADGAVQVARHLPAAVGRGLADRSWMVSRIEVRLAGRLAARQPFLTLTAVIALGVGIGLAAGGVSLFQQVFYSALPFDDGDRWVVIQTYDEAEGRRSRLDLERLRAFREASAFLYIGGSDAVDFNVLHPSGEVERVAGARVTPRTFEHLPYAPTAGRLLGAGDGEIGAPSVALIRESYHRRRWAGEDPIGRTLDLGGVRHEIVGVLPDDAGYPSDGEIWIPLPEASLGALADRDPVAGTRQLGILADGVSREQAEDRLAEVSRQISAPGRGVDAQRHRIIPITRTFVSPQAQWMAVLMILALVTVLAVIAANAANLIVARTSRRAPEIAVRNALGASRARLVSQLFVEALVIVTLAAIPGLLLAGALLRVYDRALDELPFWIDLGLRPSTAAIVAALALVSATVMGVLPALRATGASAGDALRSAGRQGGLGVGRIGGAMILAEVVMSVALLGAAALFADGFRSYVDPDFHLPDDRVLTARVSVVIQGNEVAWAGVDVADSLATMTAALETRLAETPGIRAVGLASHLPRLSPYPVPLDIEGGAGALPTPLVEVRGDLLGVLGIEPSVGRALGPADLADGAAPVALVNEAFAIEHFGSVEAVGRRLRMAAEGEETPPAWREIVGVVPNVMEVTASAPASGVYVPMQPRSRFRIAVDVGSDPTMQAGLLRRTIYDLDSGLDVTEIVPLDEVGAENRVALAAMSSTLVGVAVVTLLLALAGVYSIVSLSVSQRTREIGVRVALGAEPASVLWAVVRRSAVLVGVGGTIGALIGLQISRVRLFVFPIPEASPWLFPGLVAAMLLAGVSACWVPARRALRIQPVEALRSDG